MAGRAASNPRRLRHAGEDRELPGVRIEIQRDQMAATLIVEPGFVVNARTSGFRDALLQQSKLAVSPEVVAAYDALVAEMPEGNDTITGTIAEGRAPEPGADGRIEWADDLSPHESATDESLASVSFYERSAFMNVVPGQVVGRLAPPSEGVDGVDVTGKVLPARPGRPACLSLDSTTVALRDDGTLAALAGGVVSSSCGRVAVRPCLVVPRDVDFSTGNIDTPDEVLVRGSVRDKFTVRSGGNIGVLGRIHASTVDCDGDLHAMGGVVGNGKARLNIDGCLHTRYLTQCAGVVKADAHIQREAVHCDFDVFGRLDMPHGTLVGGRWSVGREAIIHHLGAPAGMTTELHLGRVHELEAFLARLDKLIVQLEEAGGPAEDQLNKAYASREKLVGDIEAKRVYHLQVFGQLRPGVIVRTANAAFRFDRAIAGPLTITADDDGNLIYQRSGRGCGLLGQIAATTLAARPAA